MCREITIVRENKGKIIIRGSSDHIFHKDETRQKVSDIKSSNPGKKDSEAVPAAACK